ncbi:MAG TPA: GNAT family N-acetyltransferase [Parasegetibacter sp.]
MISFNHKSFAELSPNEIYQILRLRSEVFVVEQNCVYLDADNKDPHCIHLMGWQNNQLIAYSRIVPPGISYVEPSIGRVVTSPLVRRKGVGRQLMLKSLEVLYNNFGKTAIKIGAQFYLKQFYESLGFRQNSEIYDEDGIEHIEMVRK